MAQEQEPNTLGKLTIDRSYAKLSGGRVQNTWHFTVQPTREGNVPEDIIKSMRDEIIKNNKRTKRKGNRG